MGEIFDTEILDKAMWNIYQTMKDDNFQFDGYSIEDKHMMINSTLPYFENIEEYEICQELKNKIMENLNISDVSGSLYEFTMTNKNGKVTKSTIPCDDWIQANRVKTELLKSKNLIKVDFETVQITYN